MFQREPEWRLGPSELVALLQYSQPEVERIRREPAVRITQRPTLRRQSQRREPLVKQVMVNRQRSRALLRSRAAEHLFVGIPAAASRLAEAMTVEGGLAEENSVEQFPGENLPEAKRTEEDFVVAHCFARAGPAGPGKPELLRRKPPAGPERQMAMSSRETLCRATIRR